MSKPSGKVVSSIADKNRHATWNDLQDLRRGLQGHVDVKIDKAVGGLEKRMDERFDRVEADISTIKAALEQIQCAVMVPDQTPPKGPVKKGLGVISNSRRRS